MVCEWCEENGSRNEENVPIHVHGSHWTGASKGARTGQQGNDDNGERVASLVSSVHIMFRNLVGQWPNKHIEKK